MTGCWKDGMQIANFRGTSGINLREDSSLILVTLSRESYKSDTNEAANIR